MNNKVIEEIEQLVEKHEMIEPGDRLIMGLSGGPDSLCLFDVLLKLRSKYDFEIEAVHVNHMFRPGAADEDQEFVEKFCSERGIRCNSFTIDCNELAKERGLSSEEAGREARYESFTTIAKAIETLGVEKEKIKIVIAQNRDDQAETILFRILRGSGTDGLVGIEYKRKGPGGYTIIRPLLDTARTDIENYCASEGLDARIDLTNNELIYTRNKIRLGLIPYIDETFEIDSKRSILRLRENIVEDSDYLQGEADKAFKEQLISREGPQITIRRSGFENYHEAIRHRVILRAFGAAGLTRDITRKHILAADELIRSGNTSGSVDFPGGYILRIAYDEATATIRNAEAVKPPKLIVSTVDIENYVQKQNAAVFDADELPGDAIEFRTRREGDYMMLNVGTKMIQDLFVDMKVPRHLRDDIYMATIGSEVLWIPDADGKARFAEKYSVSSLTKRVLLLEIER